MFPRASHGFTLVELIMVLIITGIMTAVVAPKLMDNSDIQARGFADQVQASLRYAQKTAISQRRFVCAAFTSSRITLTINVTAACLPGTALALASADGKPTSIITAPTGITFVTAPPGIAVPTTPSNFSFDALGRPSPNAQKTIHIAGAASAITVERETGYVH